VEAENLQAAANRVRDPAIAVSLAKQIRTQITTRAEDAVKAQASAVSPHMLRTLIQDFAEFDATGELGA